MVEVLQLLPPRCPVGSLVASLAPVPVMSFLRLWGSTSAPEQWESWGNCFKIKGEEVGLTSSFDGHFGLRVYFFLVGFPRFSWLWKSNPSMPAMETQHFGWLVFSHEFRVSEAVCFPKPTTNTCLTKWGPTVSVVAKPTFFFANGFVLPKTSLVPEMQAFDSAWTAFELWWFSRHKGGKIETNNFASQRTGTQLLIQNCQAM